MFIYLCKRLLATIPVITVVAIFVFMMLRFGATDPAAVIAGENSNSAQIEQIRSHLGLDQPIVKQFGIWAMRTLSGDLGESFFFKKPVAELILNRLEPTLSLALCTIIISVLIAVPIGVLAAFKSGGWVDRLVMGFSALGFSIPVFVIGYLLILVFAVHLNWLPVQGYQRIGNGVWGWLRHLMLPSVALSIVYCALIARITRTSVQEVLDEDYIRTARAKGLSNRVVLMRHALRTAAVPIVTVIGLGLALLIGGVVVTESVFSIPGLGRLTVDAVLARDFPTVQALVLLFSLVFVGVNLLVDLSYIVLDPRIRY
ncbi:MAG: ABC transporter permease [Pollutimonas bauzanensis]